MSQTLLAAARGQAEPALALLLQVHGRRQLGLALVAQPHDQRAVAVRLQLDHVGGVDDRGPMDPDEAPRVELLVQLRKRDVPGIPPEGVRRMRGARSWGSSQSPRGYRRLIDALREGRVRERQLAEKELSPRQLSVRANAALAMQGASMGRVQELVGHQSLAMTQRYAHLSPAALDATIRLLEQRPIQRAVGDSLETPNG